MSSQPARIFLLSHMRAFSSLIGHILGSHADINGYYEMHISYQHKTDLRQQQDLYSQQETIKPDSQFLFDKLLHNKYELDLAGLNLSQPKYWSPSGRLKQALKALLICSAKNNSASVTLSRLKRPDITFNDCKSSPSFVYTTLNSIIISMPN